MKNFNRTFLTSLLVFAIFGIAHPYLLAQEAKIDGIIDIDYPNAKAAKVEVNLEGEILFTMAKSMAANDPEASKFLLDLKGVKVRIYEAPALEGKSLEEIMKFYQDQLPKEKWKVMARVNEKDSNVGVYTFAKGEYVAGIVVLVASPKELIAVNIAGKIDPAKLAKLPQIYGQMQGFPKMGDLAKMAPKTMEKEPNFVIKGIVKDAQTGKPIEGAKISDGEYGPEPHKGATTDAKGQYSYKTWYEEHFIVAEAPNYKVQKHLLTTSITGKEEEAVINFELTPK